MTSTTPRFRLWLSFTFCFAAGASLLFLYAVHRQSSLASELLEAQAGAVAANIAALSRLEVAANDRIALATRLESFNDFEYVRSIVISDRREEPLAAVRRNAAGNLNAAPGHEVELTQEIAAPQRTALGLIIEHPVKLRLAIGEIAPIGWVHLEYEVTALVSAQRRMLVDGAVFLAFILTTSALLFSLCLRSVVIRPS